MPVTLEDQTFITDWNTHTRSCWPHNIVATDSIIQITFYPITVFTRGEFVIKITCAYYHIYITTMTTLQLLLSLMLCDFTRKSINSFRSRALLTLGCSPLHHPKFPNTSLRPPIENVHFISYYYTYYTFGSYEIDCFRHFLVCAFFLSFFFFSATRGDRFARFHFWNVCEN